MLSVAELHVLIDKSARPLAPVHLPLDAARGLRLDQTVLADSDQPAFDRSAMDGFAVNSEAKPGRFKIIGETLPGQAASLPLREGEALRIYTGSALPSGVMVVMQEHVVEKNGFIVVENMSEAGHVRQRGSTTAKGDVLIRAGTVLTPAALAVLASTGTILPRVTPRPRVGHLTTGSEVIPADAAPQGGQIRDTNSHLIRALVEEAGAAYTTHQHVSESLEAGLLACKKPSMTDADVLLVSGGSSAGKHDHTAALLEALGFTIVCRKVNCRPGKPLLLGLRENRIAIGLPGNPVSHFATFHVFVHRILRRLAGLPIEKPILAELSKGALLKSNQRETFWPAKAHLSLQRLFVTPMPWLDSGHLSALLGVNALIRFPADAEVPRIGNSVEIIPCGNF